MVGGDAWYGKAAYGYFLVVGVMGVSRLVAQLVAHVKERLDQPDLELFHDTGVSHEGDQERGVVLVEDGDFAFLGAAGFIGLAVGFAVRDTIENYIASIMLSVGTP